MADVSPAPLYQVRGEAAALLLISLAGEVFRQIGEIGMKQFEKRPECLLVAAVGSRGDQNQVASLGWIG